MSTRALKAGRDRAELHTRLEGSVDIEVRTSHHLFTLSSTVDAVIEQTRVMTTGDAGNMEHSSRSHSS